MATLSIFLRTLELIEELGSFASFLISTAGTILLLVCLVSYQLLLVVGYPPIASATAASTITIVLYHSGWLPRDTL
jgi:hypothetical protein